MEAKARAKGYQNEVSTEFGQNAAKIKELDEECLALREQIRRDRDRYYALQQQFLESKKREEELTDKYAWLQRRLKSNYQCYAEELAAGISMLQALQLKGDKNQE